jgi:hypothetical protein
MLATFSPADLVPVNGRVSLPIDTIRRGPNRPDRPRSIAAPERPFFRVSFDDVASVTYSFHQNDIDSPLATRSRTAWPGGLSGSTGRRGDRGGRHSPGGGEMGTRLTRPIFPSRRRPSTPLREDGPAWCRGTGFCSETEFHA